MLTYTLPRRIRLVPASGIFSAAFGVPTPGFYNFNSQIITLVNELLPNSVYLIDAFSIAGNVATEDFLASINIVPKLTIQKTFEEENIFDAPIQIHSFSTDRQIVHFFKTGQNKTGLAAKLTGLLNMIPPFLGLATMEISLNISLHAVDESNFERDYTRRA